MSHVKQQQHFHDGLHSDTRPRPAPRHLPAHIMHNRYFHSGEISASTAYGVLISVLVYFEIIVV